MVAHGNAAGVIFAEPAKILFLNNAINHGIFAALGIPVVSTISAIYFLPDCQPGPGMGVLLAYTCSLVAVTRNSLRAVRQLSTSSAVFTKFTSRTY